MRAAFNSKKQPESIVSSLPALQSIAELINYLLVSTNADNEVDDTNDDDPFQDMDKINTFRDDNN